MLKRRNFLKAFGTAGAAVISIFSTRRAFSKSGRMGAHGHEAHSQPEGHAHMPMAKYPPIAWADPNIPISPLFSEGRMSDESFIKPSNRFTGGMHHMHEPKEVKLWGYNGSVPGPTIEVTQGDRVRIMVKNELPEPTSIHWHGLEVPNEMDGAGGVTQPPTPPGETFIYEFTVHQVGTFMYHTGFNMMKQDSMGLGGFFVIHPKKPKHKMDRDFAMMLQAFALLPGNDRPNLVTMDFNWFTFNGKVAPDVERPDSRIGSVAW